MARREQLASLIVSLETRMEQFQRSMDTAGKRLGGVSKSLQMAQRLALGLGAAFGAAFIARHAQAAIAQADAIGKIADKTGFAVEALQELRFAGEQSGVAINTTDMALQRFSRRTGEVAQGQGELLKTAKQYGVELRDSQGNMRRNIDILEDFAEVIKHAESSQEQLRIAFKLFDSEGAALVNLMRQGKEGIRDFAKQAQDLGLVFSRDVIDNATKANDQLNIMRRVVNAQWVEIWTNLAPAVTAVGQGFVTLARSVSYANIEALDRRITTVRSNIAALREHLESPIRAFGNKLGLGSEDREINQKIQEQEQRLAELLALRDKAARRSAAGTDENSAATARNVEENYKLTLGIKTAIDQWEAMYRDMENHDALAAKHTETIEDMADAYRQGETATQQLERAMADARWERYQEQVSAAASAAGSFAQTVSSGFISGIERGQNLAETLEDIGRSLARQIAQAVLFNTIMQGLGYAGTATVPSPTPRPSPPGRAAGGPVQAGRPYIVGEHGPELMVHGRNGTVVPNGGGGANVTVHNYSGQPVQVNDAGMGGLDITVGRMVANDLRRGGPLAQAMGDTYGLKPRLKGR